MNYSLKFKNVALSALLISAISVPVIANANSTANIKDTKNDTSAAVQPLKATTAAFTMANPLELAKKYAPETVSEWEAVLEKYKEVLPMAILVDASSAQNNSEIPALPALKEGETVNISKGTLKNVDGVKIQLPVKSEDAKSNQTVAVSPKTAEGEKLTWTEVTIPAQAIATGDAKVVGNVEGVPASKAVKLDAAFPVAAIENNAFFNAQINLNDAVATKDAAKIKDALAELLKQYKAEVKVTNSEKAQPQE
ncbi:hypothetical protein [Paenibacillus agri]|uniref:Uncharacterized protein n=1 Tax=Paenibacillus agri TaxID=2744309 RepID=A0A850EQB2_9BACL|nr:hypothetical protein [Paenibacillus agri]NUU61929.1 hypothetical protein [Paenibacillus agri]